MRLKFKGIISIVLSLLLFGTSVCPVYAEEQTAPVKYSHIITEAAEVRTQAETEAETEEDWLAVAAEILRYYAENSAGLEPAITERNWRFYDVIGDKVINIDDAVYILNMYAALAAGLEFDGYIPKRDNKYSPVTGVTTVVTTTAATTKTTTTTAKPTTTTVKTTTTTAKPTTTTVKTTTTTAKPTTTTVKTTTTTAKPTTTTVKTTATTAKPTTTTVKTTTTTAKPTATTTKAKTTTTKAATTTKKNTSATTAKTTAKTTTTKAKTTTAASKTDTSTTTSKTITTTAWSASEKLTTVTFTTLTTLTTAGPVKPVTTTSSKSTGATVSGETTSAQTTTVTTTTTVITRPPVAKGIDVSVYQGDVDWEAVKESGVEFAIIRAGYGKHISQEDKNFDKNMQNAQAAGIKCGAYWFSYATTPEDAIIEADVFYEVIKGYQFEYPIIYDYETRAQYELEPEESAKIIHAFCERMESYGYYISLFSYVNFLTTRIDPEVFDCFDVWIAHYNVQVPAYYDNYGMWQYSRTGTVPGIDGDVDLDYAYFDYPSIIKRKGLNGFELKE